MDRALSGWEADELDPSMHTIEGQADETRFAVARKTVTDTNIRCQSQVPVPHETGEFKVCNRLLAVRAGRPWEMICPRCKGRNVSPSGAETV